MKIIQLHSKNRRARSVSLSFLPNKRALASAYASLLAIILIMAMLALVLSLYISYDESIVDKMELTQQKAREKLTIKQAIMTDNHLDVYLSNLGDKELKVRAIYLKNENISTFVENPNTLIGPHRTEKIEVTIPAESRIFQ